MNMILYEVNLVIDPNIEQDYDTWLDAHIHEILTIEGFVGARWWFDSRYDAKEKSNQLHYTVQYELKDSMALQHYLDHHAPRLRQKGLDRFGEKFTATRRVLKLKKDYRK